MAELCQQLEGNYATFRNILLPMSSGYFEDGDNTILQNTDNFLPDSTASHFIEE